MRALRQRDIERVTGQRRDVGEYFDRAEKAWEKRGCESERLHRSPLFEYEVDEQSDRTGRGHVLVRLTFPGFDHAYLAVEDWLRPYRGYIRREYYAYDLVVKGVRVLNWHRHHGGDHSHAGGKKVPHPRITLIQAIERSVEYLYTWYNPHSP